MRPVSLAVAGSALLLAGACDRAPEHTYAPEVVARFIESCVARAPAAICHCALTAIERQFSLEQFLGFEERIRKGDVPKELADAVSSCR